MEFGPRALGNRSILYHAKDPAVNDWLNKQLKRSEFMPFAPVTLAEHAGACYYGARGRGAHRRVHDDHVRRDAARCASSHPPCVHVDGTARPQLVDGGQQPVAPRDAARSTTSSPASRRSSTRASTCTRSRSSARRRRPCGRSSPRTSMRSRSATILVVNDSEQARARREAAEAVRQWRLSRARWIPARLRAARRAAAAARLPGLGSVRPAELPGLPPDPGRLVAAAADPLEGRLARGARTGCAASCASRRSRIRRSTPARTSAYRYSGDAARAARRWPTASPRLRRGTATAAPTGATTTRGPRAPAG